MGRHTHLNFYLNNAKLEIVTSFKYISIHFLKKMEIGTGHKKDYYNMLLLLYIIYSFFFDKLNLQPLRNVN